MTSNPQPPSNAPPAGSVHVADRQARARARTAIGLEPDRATAPATYVRPPDEDERGAQRLLVACVALLGLAVVLLLVASLLDPNSTLAALFGTRVSVQTNVAPASAADAAPALPDSLNLLPGYQLWLNDDFAAASNLVTADSASGGVVSSLLADRGVYRMQVTPSQMGWTLFDLADTTSFHVETSATVDAALPAGAAGVITRFAGAGNFYLLSVDGAGAVNVQLWLGGAPTALPSNALTANGAGQANRLAIADDGQRLHFYVNQVLVAEVADPQLPFGRPGLAALAASEQDAGVDFDWIAIYRPE